MTKRAMGAVFLEIKLFELAERTDNRGSLVALELGKGVSYDIKRVYYMYQVPSGMTRGFHAHRDLRQLHICVSGSCRIMLDDGEERQEVLLDRPNLGLLLDRPTWREIYDFSPNCVLLVLCDKYHDDEDYIRDYTEFLKLVGKG